MSNSVWRRRSALGLIACERGAASGRPRNSPPTIRTRALPALALGGLAQRRPLVRFWRGRRRADGRVEVGVGGGCELVAELIAQNLPPNLAQFALLEVADL